MSGEQPPRIDISPGDGRLVIESAGFYAVFAACQRGVQLPLPPQSRWCTYARVQGEGWQLSRDPRTGILMPEAPARLDTTIRRNLLVVPAGVVPAIQAENDLRTPEEDLVSDRFPAERLFQAMKGRRLRVEHTTARDVNYHARPPHALSRPVRDIRGNAMFVSGGEVLNQQDSGVLFRRLVGQTLSGSAPSEASMAIEGCATYQIDGTRCQLDIVHEDGGLAVNVAAGVLYGDALGKVTPSLLDPEMEELRMALLSESGLERVA